ncbi:MAG: hypothetical protein GC204_19405 [Chloroflexi bacterium]|nr:hypothetical protein [Chloroflexota bacterium]
MLASAEFLWRVNQDYVNRLAKARNYLDLLEQLVLERSEIVTQDRLLPTLQFTRVHLTDLSAEQRNWCYRYFYESPVTKRIVQTPNAVQNALTSFGAMCEQHRNTFGDLASLLTSLPRPKAAVTRVPNGDLWEMVRFALNDLIDFSDNLNIPELA